MGAKGPFCSYPQYLLTKDKKLFGEKVLPPKSFVVSFSLNLIKCSFPFRRLPDKYSQFFLTGK